MAATDYAGKLSNPNHYSPWDGHERAGDYTELQVGPAASQEHVFPVVGNSEYQWTEWFAGWQADPIKMQDRDYNIPLQEIAAFLDGDSKPALHPSMINDIDQFLANVSNIVPQAHEILHVGQPWGALHEKLTGKRLARGLYFNITKTPETKPWLELLDADGKTPGTFSKETLGLTPRSFQVDALWMAKITESANAHGWTWLHHLHAGTIELEIGNVGAARKHFEDSLNLKVTPHAARNLAIFVPTPVNGSRLCVCVCVCVSCKISGAGERVSCGALLRDRLECVEANRWQCRRSQIPARGRSREGVLCVADFGCKG